VSLILANHTLESMFDGDKLKLRPMQTRKCVWKFIRL